MWQPAMQVLQTEAIWAKSTPKINVETCKENRNIMPDIWRNLPPFSLWIICDYSNIEPTWGHNGTKFVISTLIMEQQKTIITPNIRQSPKCAQDFDIFATT